MKKQSFGLTIYNTPGAVQLAIGATDEEMRWISIRSADLNLSVAHYIREFPKWREMLEESLKWN